MWLFDVAKNFSGETAGDEIVLEFSDVDAIPEGLAILLVDRTLERAMDVRKEIRCLFYQGTRGYVARDDDARFALLVGSDEFVESYGDGLPAHPSETVLHQNHPNPFNPSTIIRYELAKTGRVTLKLYDVSGALVKVLEDRDREPGRYEVGWNGLNERGEHVSSGVYFYVLETPGARLAKKMLCVK
ncbi:MAG: T9SS type A sorting domain-containing protein [Chitinivibrionia bacterium]|nr:T9SS type A sorting domain-containing protein [Chitinivibrionia bacterium]